MENKTIAKKSIGKFVKTIGINADGYVVNGKYLIDNQGTIWYDYGYVGYRKDFPQWLFQLRDDLLGK